SLAIEDRSNGYPRHHTVSLDFVTAPDYRTLLNSYREIRDIKPPMVVVSTGATAESEEEVRLKADATDDTGGVRLQPDQTDKKSAKPRVEPEVKIGSLDELIEYFINAGKRGVAINRYKGL